MEQVGVVGCGLMGAGIAEVSARAGKDVVVVESSVAAAEAGRRRLEGSLERAESGGNITSAAQVLDRIRVEVDVDALADRDIVVEAIAEDEAAKIELFARLDHEARRRDRTAEPGARRALLQPRSIDCQDRAGFVVNSLLIPFVLSAIRMLESGFATAEDIDECLVRGAAHPQGPLALADLIGLDTARRSRSRYTRGSRSPCTRRRRCSPGWSRPACSAARPAAASIHTEKNAGA